MYIKLQRVLCWNAIKLSKIVTTRRKVWHDFENPKGCFVCSLKVAEGCSRKSETERKRYYEIARGSIIEIDAALDIAKELNYLETVSLENLGKQMINCFKC